MNTQYTLPIDLNVSSDIFILDQSTPWSLITTKNEQRVNVESMVVEFFKLILPTIGVTKKSSIHIQHEIFVCGT